MNFSVEKRNKYLQLMIKFQKEHIEKGEQCLFYKCGGKNVLIPGEVLSFIKENVAAAFKVLDTLPHDKE